MPRFFWVIAAVLAGATIANACPPGPCNKYRHIQRPPLVRATATTYMRAARSQPRASIAWLTGSPWIPQDHAIARPGVLPALPIHFLDARQFKTPARADERAVFVRRIEQRDRISMVEVDGDVFELTACRDSNRQWTSCLTQRTDLSFDVPDHDDHDDGGHFAQPPP